MKKPHAIEISKGENTFYIFKFYNKYIAFQSGFGNLIRINGQIAYGSVNRVSSLIPFVKKINNSDKLKIFYMTYNMSKGFILSKSKPHTIFGGEDNPSMIYNEVSANFLDSNTPIYYDYINLKQNMFFCIQTNNNDYFLYDTYLTTPLKSIIVDNTRKFIIKSKEKNDTMRIIQSLPKKSIVYSLKVDAAKGLVKGDTELSDENNIEEIKKTNEDIKNNKDDIKPPEK